MAQIISLVALALLYFPPKHPKGVAWKDAVRGLDYVGTILVVPGVCLALVGIINTTYMPATSVLVLAPLIVGIVLLAGFGLWETFSKTEVCITIFTKLKNIDRCSLNCVHQESSDRTRAGSSQCE